MQDMPLVSVIIPVYKTERYLHRCIDSLVNQDYKNIEIILIDDGSPDHCGNICDEYAKKDKRIKVIHQRNKGLSAARNAGLDFCTGEYLCFVDSDDYVNEKMVVDNIKLAIQVNADIVIFNSMVVYGSHVRNLYGFSVKDQMNTESLIRILSCGCIPMAWGKFYKSKVWERVRFPEGVLHEDLYIIPTLLDNNIRMVANSKAYYFYENSSSSSIVHSENSKLFYYEFLAWNRYLDILSHNEERKFYYSSCYLKYIKISMVKSALNSVILNDLDFCLSDDERKKMLDYLYDYDIDNCLVRYTAGYFDYRRQLQLMYLIGDCYPEISIRVLRSGMHCLAIDAYRSFMSNDLRNKIKYVLNKIGPKHLTLGQKILYYSTMRNVKFFLSIRGKKLIKNKRK